MAQISQSRPLIWIGWSHNPEVAGSNPPPLCQNLHRFRGGRRVSDGGTSSVVTVAASWMCRLGLSR